MASLEGAHFIKSNTLEKFAEQQLVDCVKTCFGCNGGNVVRAVQHMKLHDAMLESAYPYTATDGTCTEINGTGVRPHGVVNVTKNSPDAMKTALQIEPLSVAVDASKMSFAHYLGGLYDKTNCGTDLDHAINVVGWGEEDGQEYWILRNSWSTRWGESGYMRDRKSVV